MNQLARFCSFFLVALLALGATGCLRQSVGAEPVASVPEPPAATAIEALDLASALQPIPAWHAPATELRPGFALVSFGTTSAPPPIPTRRACPAIGTRVLLIGDSLSQGLGPAMKRLAQGCGTAYHHRGVVGSHVTQWQQDHWLGEQLRRAQPTVVMMSMGGNDFQRSDAHRVQPAIARVIAEVEASGARFLWISPPTMPFEDRIDVRGMWAEALALSPATATYPTEELVIPRVSDRVHPTPAGNRALAETLWGWMANLEG